ncbi:hypothetical protein BCR44DRAFT_38112 [Catenaria anguillulae PL171]|uniref:Uncharacterized protein n=1 Tax=Catenaria anguillulae PL171 TaxID=765915 RepID=A0A1Y2I5D4_9FUNG|nr:hypothetical protein BCR44DRAFT_38112 [Catenaria anguillulae PL171]
MWLNKDHELAQAKLKEWVKKKQRELLSASQNTRLNGRDILQRRKQLSAPTTPKKQARPSSIPVVSPPSAARRRAIPLTVPTTPVTSPKPPKTADSQAAYLEWLKRKSAELNRAAIERARQDTERAALRAAATALAKQRYDEWKAARKAPPPPTRPKLHQFPIVPPSHSSSSAQQEPRVTFADVFGDIAFYPGYTPDMSQHTTTSGAPTRSTGNPQRLAFGRPIANSTSHLSNPSSSKRAISTASRPLYLHHPEVSDTEPPNLLSPPGMFAELERMQRHYPAYLKRFPGHVAHAGASVGKVWIDPRNSMREQAAKAAKWARLNAAVGCYCHDQQAGKCASEEHRREDVHALEEVEADMGKKQGMTDRMKE